MTESPPSLLLTDRLHAVEEQIQTACAKAGRNRAEITLIAVTKVFPASIIEDAYALGLRHFGENYVQEFEGKAAQVKHLPGAVFHLIGHLQSNKAKKAVELFDVLQTVDSSKLAQRIESFGEPRRVMLEVKLSSEEAKHGAAPEELDELVAAVRACPHLELTGLMTMPPWSDDAEPSRPYFHRLAELATKYSLPDLSMGMSHDFGVAIEEGATHIRVGTALFGKRRKP